MQTLHTTMDIAAVQRELKRQAVDGWLFYSFRGSDPLAALILGLDSCHFVSRRWFYLIPAEGHPHKLVHRIETDALDSLPGNKTVYLGWRELEQKLSELLSGKSKVAMQYSPDNAIPYVSRVDAGTVELVKKCGTNVVTSADLVQMFEARLTPAQLESHTKAVENLRVIVFEAFAQVAQAVRTGKKINEFEIQQFICQRFEHYSMVTNSPPIVAVNEHSGSPHYQPTKTIHSEIKSGDFLLLDIWAKLEEPANSVYGDITWTGFVGEKVPDKYTKIFQIVSGARDAAVAFIKQSLSEGKHIEGWQVDDVTRQYITQRGHGQDFIHRTGHSIGLEVHGNGANIDNLETQDRRRLMSNTCFSIEPGIYLPEFGIRSEIDVYITDKEAFIAGQPIQSQVIPIMAL